MPPDPGWTTAAATATAAVIGAIVRAFTERKRSTPPEKLQVQVIDLRITIRIE